MLTILSETFLNFEINFSRFGKLFALTETTTIISFAENDLRVKTRLTMPLCDFSSYALTLFSFI